MMGSKNNFPPNQHLHQDYFGKNGSYHRILKVIYTYNFEKTKLNNLESVMIASCLGACFLSLHRSPIASNVFFSTLCNADCDKLPICLMAAILIFSSGSKNF